MKLKNDQQASNFKFGCVIYGSRGLKDVVVGSCIRRDFEKGGS